MVTPLANLTQRMRAVAANQSACAAADSDTPGGGEDGVADVIECALRHLAAAADPDRMPYGAARTVHSDLDALIAAYRSSNALKR